MRPLGEIGPDGYYDMTATLPGGQPIRGGGWSCLGCGIDTLSHCMRCDEPMCGNCLARHECAEVPA